jgi:hypothetical protein
MYQHSHSVSVSPIRAFVVQYHVDGVAHSSKDARTVVELCHMVAQASHGAAGEVWLATDFRAHRNPEAPWRYPPSG